MAGFLVWSLVVFLVMALMPERDRTKADRQLDRKVEILEHSVASSAGEPKGVREHLHDGTNNQEETVGAFYSKNPSLLDLRSLRDFGIVRPHSWQKLTLAK